MKDHLLYLLLLTGLMACQEENGFKLTGKVSEPLIGESIRLKYPISPKDSFFLTTTVDNSGHFCLSGSIIPQKMAFLQFGYHRLPIYMENQHYQVIPENDHYYILSNTRNSLQNRYVQFLKQIYTLDSAYHQLGKGYDTITDIGQKTALSARMKKSFSFRNEQILRGIQEFAGTEIALNILYESLYLCEVDYRFFNQAMDALGDNIPESDLKTEILAAYQKAKDSQLSGPAPAFCLPDTLNQMHSLKEFQGKYLLIDFWASWCAPCRVKNKELNKHWDELKKMNLNIVSISMDSHRQEWLTAVREDKIAWLQLIDPKGFKDSEIRTAYKVKSIPAVFLIDPQGKVLMTDPSIDDIKKWTLPSP